MAIVEKRPAVYLSSKRTSNVYQRIVNFIFIIFPWWSNLTPPENSLTHPLKSDASKTIYFPFSEAELLNCWSVRAVGPPRKMSFPTWFGQIEGVPSSRNWFQGSGPTNKSDLDVGWGEKNAKQKWKKTKKKHHLSVLVTFHRNPSIDHWVGGSLEKRSLDPHFSLVC